MINNFSASFFFYFPDDVLVLFVPYNLYDASQVLGLYKSVVVLKVFLKGENAASESERGVNSSLVIIVNKYIGIYLAYYSLLHAVYAYYGVYLVVFEKLLVLHFSKTIHFIVLL